MKVLVTGDRHWSDREIIRRALSALPRDTVIVHGCCHTPVNADKLAAEVALELGMPIAKPPTWTNKWGGYPADWSKGKKAGPMRNKTMFDSEYPIDLVLAFHDDLYHQSTGTKDMVKYAQKNHTPVKLFSHSQPDGIAIDEQTDTDTQGQMFLT